VTRPDGLALGLFAGDAVPTEAVASVDLTNGRITVIRNLPGDGRVTRSSALLDERMGGATSRTLISPMPWTQVTFLFSNHIGLTKDPTFTDNILYFLLEQPT
jgi:hypothetical protein